MCLYFNRITNSVCVAVSASLILVGPSAASPPAHDNCNSAAVIDGNDFESFSIDLNEATTQSCEPVPGCAPAASHSVWYTFTAPGDGTLEVSATSFALSFHPVAAIYEGCAISVFGDCLQPASLGCSVAVANPQVPGILRAECRANVTEGESYLIELASSDGAGGLVFAMRTSWHPHVANDDCHNATQIHGELVDAQDVFNAYAPACQGIAPSCYGVFGVGNPVWYRFDATWPGTLQVDTFGTSYATNITVFDSCPLNVPNIGCVLPQELACQSGEGGAGTAVELPTDPGDSMLVRVGQTFDSGTGSSLQFHGRFIPANDSCNGATVIVPHQFHPPLIQIGGADATNAEPQESCDTSIFGVANSVYFSFTPGTDGLCSINTMGSNYDTVLSVFDGCGLLTVPGGFIQPNQLACHNDIGGLAGAASAISSLPLNADTTYIIKVATNTPTGADAGLLDFNFQFEPLPMCPADIAPQPDGNSIVNIDDLLLVIATWGSGGAGDVNSDGVVNIQDLLAVIAAWGACP